MIPAILAAIAAAAPFLSRRWTGDWASPWAIIVVVWCGTLALFSLRVVPYVAIDARTWGVIAASLALLLAGLFIGFGLARRNAARKPTTGQYKHANRWVRLYAIAGLAGLAWYVWEVQARLGWHAFGDATLIRVALGAYTIPSRFLFLQYFSIAAPLIAIVFILIGRRLSSLEVAGTLACAIGTWLSTDRTQFFTLALVALFLYLHLKGSRLSWRQVVLAGAAVLVLLLINFGVVARWVGKTPVANAYLYATASYPAFHNALQRPPASTQGAHTFFPVVRLLQKAGVLDTPVPSPILDHTTVTTGNADAAQTFNGYTFLIYPYEDWGINGVLLYALSVGVVVGLVYRWMRLEPGDARRLVLMAFISGALTLSPFVNKFNNTAWWYICLLTMAPFLLSTTRATDEP